MNHVRTAGRKLSKFLPAFYSREDGLSMPRAPRRVRGRMPPSLGCRFGRTVIDLSRECFARFEIGQQLRLDLDGFAGLRIATFVALVATDVKRAQPSDLDALASLQSRFQAVEDDLDDQLGTQHLNLVLLAYKLDKAGADHGSSFGVTSGTAPA